MKCVSCGASKMVHEVRDVTYTYKGKNTTIADVGGLYCKRCNESLHTEEESRYLHSEMTAFNKEVNASMVAPEFISETRKKLKLDQRQAAELFGGGPNAFSRYENGKTEPPLSLVQLFKLLNEHPELLDELRPKKATSTTDSKTRLKRRKEITA